jgi:hypothetical protein
MSGIENDGECSLELELETIKLTVVVTSGI